MSRSLAQLMNLTGRKALVTGGAGHIGLHACEALIELGATVAVLDIDAAICQKAVDTLAVVRAGSAIALPCDLKDEKEARTAIQTAISNMGGLDILIHCAALVGITRLPGWVVPFDEQTVAAWDAAMRVNLTSAFIMVQAAQSALSESGHGSVVFFGSTYGVVGPDNRLYEGTAMGTPAGYAASKGGIIQLARYLATTLAPSVRVNAITPGGLWRNQPEVFHERYVSRTPLGRMASAEDMKGAIAYLASDVSAYVTGHNLVVDGGWTAW